MATVRDILKALDVITGGRVITDSFGYGGANPFVVTKTSGIPGKAVTELPGLVWGDPDMPVKKVAVMMTLTESAIELAGATGIDCLIAHHPIAEGSNTGGVTARDYFNLYHLAVFELHEAFHGLHPGIAWIHGSCAKHVNIRFGGVPGKIVWYGNALPEVETLGDLLNRIDTIMGTDIESRVLTSERQIRGCTEIHETSIAARAKIFVGSPDNQAGQNHHCFPAYRFLGRGPGKSLRRIPRSQHRSLHDQQTAARRPAGQKSRRTGPEPDRRQLSRAGDLRKRNPPGLGPASADPELDIHIFRERMVSLPLDHCGCTHIENYGETMARNYLPKPKTE